MKYFIISINIKYINKREKEREINNNAISIFFGLLFKLNEVWNLFARPKKVI